MYRQKPNPYPADWLGETILGFPRYGWAFIGLWFLIVVGYGLVDWNWVLGLR